jgi:hypothetical protein
MEAMGSGAITLNVATPVLLPPAGLKPVRGPGKVGLLSLFLQL